MGELAVSRAFGDSEFKGKPANPDSTSGAEGRYDTTALTTLATSEVFLPSRACMSVWLGAAHIVMMAEAVAVVETRGTALVCPIEVVFARVSPTLPVQMKEGGGGG